MVQVSGKAVEMLTDFFKKRDEISPIRIYLHEGG
jgi:hypothetical protein